MNGIGWAVAALKEGAKVRRAGWNGKGMFLVLMDGSGAGVPASRRALDLPAGRVAPNITMWTAQKEWQPGWLCSQADILADDWELAT